MIGRGPSELFRYGLALTGPVAAAGVQFALSLVLLNELDAGAFGRFSFLLIVAQLSWGVWTALFSAPMPLLLAQSGGQAASDPIRALLTANLFGAAASWPVFAATALLLGERVPSAAAFGLFAAMALLRWFARSHAYTMGQPLRVTLSDAAYSLTLLGGLALILVMRPDDTLAAWTVLALASMVGLAPFGRRYLIDQFTAVVPRRLDHYRPIWREHARWSLLGIGATEATANAHAYLVTLFLGPTAFAPLAASALLIRPISVAANALSEFERGRLGRALGSGDTDQVWRTVGFFRLMLVLAWLATATAVLALLATRPGLVFPPQYSATVLRIGAALWLVTGLMRLLRTPDSVVLQAGGMFRPLAITSLWSSLASVVSVAVLLAVAAPLWSIAGVALGEAVACGLILREARRWMRQRDHGSVRATRHDGVIPAGPALP